MVQTKEDVKTWLADNGFEAYVSNFFGKWLYTYKDEYKEVNYFIKCFVLRAFYSKVLWVMAF